MAAFNSAMSFCSWLNICALCPMTTFNSATSCCSSLCPQLSCWMTSYVDCDDVSWMTVTAHRLSSSVDILALWWSCTDLQFYPHFIHIETTNKIQTRHEMDIDCELWISVREYAVITPDIWLCFSRHLSAFLYSAQLSCLSTAKMTARCALWVPWILKIFDSTYKYATATFAEIFYGFLFRSILRMCVQNLKLVVLPIPEIIGLLKKFGQSLFFQILMGFCSDGPCQCIRRPKFAVRSFTGSWDRSQLER